MDDSDAGTAVCDAILQGRQRPALCSQSVAPRLPGEAAPALKKISYFIDFSSSDNLFVPESQGTQRHSPNCQMVSTNSGRKPRGFESVRKKINPCPPTLEITLSPTTKHSPRRKKSHIRKVGTKIFRNFSPFQSIATQ
jgi:hypothetical protein